jgi:ATP-dependent RNA helicase DeaD
MTDSDSPQPLDTGFSALGISPDLATTLVALGYEEPTPIQREAIPPLLAGRDLLGQAATGTGKTAAFALPILQRVVRGEPEPGRPRALVLVPTRELAMQVAEAIHRYGKEKRASVLPIYGGQFIGQQLRALSRGVEVVVATPGRALDHVERGTIDLASVGTVVLDEADEMLDMGFADDLEALLERTPVERQTALFSATLPRRILAIAEKHLRDPVRIAIALERTDDGEVPRVRQVAYVVQRAHKPIALGRVLDMESPASTIVFCRTRLEVDELTEAMNAHGYRAEALHGGFAQQQRDRVMKRFRESKADLLIATDVAARGLDIEHVSHVVNYDVPTEPDAYVHRIGRTGRAGRDGVAITLIEPREHRLLRNIQRATKQKIAVETLPTVADLRNRRLELTRASLREAVVAGELDPFRRIVEELSSDLDPLDVAAAAVKLAHEATHAASAEQAAQEQDLSAELVPAPRERGPNRERRFERGPRFERAPREDRAPQRERAPWDERAPRDDRPPRRGPRGPMWDTVRLFVGAGRMAQLRPADLVGAIANEAGIDSSAIGAIEIADRFSLVEVPADAAEHIVRALRSTTLRGRRVVVRRDRDS